MIRTAKIEDKQAINDLGKKLNPNYENLFKLEDILIDKYARMYVYEKDKKVIAFIHATVLDEFVDIVNLIVLECERGKKIATNLFDYLLSDIPKSIKSITLEVNVNNLPAINFYKKFGLEIIHTREKYYNGIDAYLMGRKM